MSMSKKDYETIAEVLTTCSNDRDDVILQLAWRFAQENPNFRWDLFLKAADYTGDYEVNAFGVIASPGKFEAESVYAPLAYQAWLEGDGIETDAEGVYQVTILWAGDEAFAVEIYEDERGFVYVAGPE